MREWHFYQIRQICFYEDINGVFHFPTYCNLHKHALKKVDRKFALIGKIMEDFKGIFVFVAYKR